MLWSTKCCAVIKTDLCGIWKPVILLYLSAFHISWLCWNRLLRRTIFSTCVWPWECPQSSPSCLSVGARRSPQAFLWPPLPSRLAACQCVSKTQSLTQWLEVSKDNSANLDSLGVCVCVEFCGEGSSAFCLIDTLCDLFRVLLQWAVLSLIPGQDVLAAAAVLPQLGHLLPQRRVFPLQEGGAHRDLVLLQPPCVARALCCHVVLLSPGPVSLILGAGEGKRVKKDGFNRQATTVCRCWTRTDHNTESNCKHHRFLQSKIMKTRGFFLCIVNRFLSLSAGWRGVPNQNNDQ